MKTMRFLRYTAVVATCATALLISASAMADRYKVATLGDSPVSYIEHRNSLNDTSQVAWTELVGSNPRARLTDASNVAVSGWPGSRTTDLHALLTSFGSTFSSDFISRAEDINNDSDVVGYATDTPLEFRRHAAMWFKKSNGSYKVIDLHAALEAHGTIGGQYDMTAAYGVSTRVDNYVFVAGYGRRSLESGSVPLVWRVNVNTEAVTGVYGYGVPQDSSMNYGILYDVAARKLGNGQIQFVAGGGFGGQTGGQAYLEAYAVEQNVSTGVSITYTPADDPSSSYATSSITRVEVLNGTMYAAGYALTTSGTADAFVWNRDEYVNGIPANSVNVGGALAQGDVALGMGLGMRADSAAIPYQPQVVGASTVGVGAVGSGNANSQSALAGFHAYIEAGAALSLDRTCDLNAELPAAANAIEIATDLNNSGMMVGWSGTKAVVTVPIAANAQPNLRTKITPSWNFWYVELPETVAAVGGRIVMSDEPGCSAPVAVGGTDPCDGLALNIQDQGGANTRWFGAPAYPSSANYFNPTGPLVALSTGATWINDNGLGFDVNNNSALPATGYMQVYARTTDGRCLISDPVDLSTVNFEQNVCEDRRVTAAWGIGAGIYDDCIQGGGIRYNSCETDIMVTTAHCGACGNNCDARCYNGGNGACSGGTCSGTAIVDNWESIGNYFAGCQEFQRVWFLDSLANIRPGFIPQNQYPTVFPITDVDEYLFVVNDEYQVGVDTVLDGGEPTGDSTSQYSRRGPTAHVTAPSGQNLQMCATVYCERGGDLLRVTTKTGNGVNTADDTSADIYPASGTKTHTTCLPVPAGDPRYIEHRADCDESYNVPDPINGGTMDDPNGLDDGILTLVTIEHTTGNATCYANGGDPFYKIQLGNRTCRRGSSNTLCQ